MAPPCQCRNKSVKSFHLRGDQWLEGVREYILTEIGRKCTTHELETVKAKANTNDQGVYGTKCDQMFKHIFNSSNQSNTNQPAKSRYR